MKKYIYLTLIFIAIFFIAPIGLNAAYNDVTLTTDAVISINSISLTVSGSSASIESIVVGSDNFVVTLQPSSTMTVTSADNKDFSTNAGSTHVTETCSGSSGSTLALTSTSLSNVDILVRVSSDTCVNSTVSSAPASSGGGGGGGGGSSSVSAPGIITTTSRLQIVRPDGTIEYLDEGATTAKTIKTSTRIPSSSITQGQIDSIIGLLKAFNAEQSIIDNVMTSLQRDSSSASTLNSSGVSGVSTMFTKGLSRGASNSDVKRLQQLLNSDTDTRIAENGAGSAGNETNFFGLMTEKAVQKFQMKHGVVSGPSDAGYGYVGPKTRAKLTEVFGQ